MISDENVCIKVIMFLPQVGKNNFTRSNGLPKYDYRPNKLFIFWSKLLSSPKRVTTTAQINN